jgi:CheY-like chemotaxis protein
VARSLQFPFPSRHSAWRTRENLEVRSFGKSPNGIAVAGRALEMMESRTSPRAQENQMNDLIPKLRVVVVDDEHIVADTLAQILTMYGYEARAHYSGEAALANSKEFRPHVVLSDVRMQGMDGIETAVQIRDFLPDCRMILFTASPVRTEIQERILQLGFEFLQRPLHPQEVLALLEDDSKCLRAPAVTACPVARQC